MAGSFGSLDAGGPLGPEGDADALERAVAELRVDEAARSRARRASLDHQAAEGATLGGVLVDLGERGAVVSIVLSDGRSVAGAVEQVGRDLVVVRGDDGQQLLVRLDAIAAATPRSRADAVRGDREVASDLSFVEALGWLAGARRTVQVHTAAETIVQGELASVGLDVAVLLLDGPSRQRTYLATAAIVQVAVLDGWG